MIRKHAVVIALALGALLVFVVLRLPMSVVAGFLPATVRLEGCEGSIWRGQASALGLGGMLVQQDIAWQLHAESLLHGRLDWEINGKYAAESSRLTLAVSPTAIILRNVNVALPLEPLLNQDAKLKPLRLGGMLKLSATEFTPQHPSEVAARLENLFSALVPAIGALGTTDIKLTTQTDRTTKWTLRPVEGALAINGDGMFNPNRGMLAGKLAFKPEASLAGSLRPILSLLQQGQNGEYILTLPSG